jgi:hypothetical protein
MKHSIKLIVSFLFAAILLGGCEKDENRIYFEGGTDPVLTGSTANVILSPTIETQEAIKLSWTNPDYKFTTGVSSQDVNYLIEFDTVGADFASNSKYASTVAKELQKSYTVAELNAILGNNMLLPFGRQYNLEARVTASLTNNAVPLTSNVVTFTATPYAPPPKVPIPDAGTLWITGDATKAGWSNPLSAPYDVDQKFTKLSNTDYELVLQMPGGGGYKLIQAQGDWGSQYHMLTGGTWQGGSFEKKDADPAFPGPPAAGTYKISVDFQLGKFTVVKQ